MEQFLDSAAKCRLRVVQPRFHRARATATDLGNLGEAYHLSGALDEAETLYKDALALYESLDDPGGRGFILGQLGRLELDRGNLAAAHKLLIDSLRLRLSAGERGAAADVLEALAELTWQIGHLDFAATVLEASNAIRTETGVARQPVYEERYQRILQHLGGAKRPMTLPDVEQILATAMSQSLEPALKNL